MARLFLAIWLPDDVTEQLMSLPRKDQRGVRFVHPENWHITLRFLGEADPDAVIERLAGLDISTSPRKRFNGHLTIARVKPYVTMPRALGTLVSAEFDVVEIALVLSRLHPDGARYDNRDLAVGPDAHKFLTVR